jgi:CheY-like chemotaxis protein
MNAITSDFIIVDDDPIINLISPKIINQVYPEARVVTFDDPDLALTYIKSTYKKVCASNALLLLDINMPTLSGWEFLDAFEKLDIRVKGRIKIYMLSYSLDPKDRERASKNKNVLGYMEKPLTKESLKTIFYSFNVLSHFSDSN